MLGPRHRKSKAGAVATTCELLRSRFYKPVGQPLARMGPTNLSKVHQPSSQPAAATSWGPRHRNDLDGLDQGDLWQIQTYPSGRLGMGMEPPWGAAANAPATHRQPRGVTRSAAERPPGARPTRRQAGRRQRRFAQDSGHHARDHSAILPMRCTFAAER
jgi:hypothetical protein